jgi:hypothetical protein
VLVVFLVLGFGLLEIADVAGRGLDFLDQRGMRPWTAAAALPPRLVSIDCNLAIRHVRIFLT